MHTYIHTYIYLKGFAPCRRPPSLRLLGTYDHIFSNIAPRGFGSALERSKVGYVSQFCLP